MNGDLLRKLTALGLTMDQVAGVVDIMDEQSEERRAKGRSRWRKWKDKQLTNVSQHEQTLAANSREGVARGEDNLLPKKISGQEDKKDSAAKPRVDLDAFRKELFPILDTERIDALIAVRRKKGATMTPHAGRLLAKALSQCPDACAAADEMVLRNWTGIKPEWLESRSAPQRQSTSPPKERTPGDVFAEIAAGKWRPPGKDYDPEYPTIDTSFIRRN